MSRANVLPYNLHLLGFAMDCDLLISDDAFDGVVLVNGSGTYDYSVPAFTWLVGLTLYFQCIVVDGGLAVSNAVAAGIDS